MYIDSKCILYTNVTLFEMNTRLILITIVASIGGLLFGYDTGVINGTQYFLSKHFDLTALEKGWVVGSALIGCFAGSAVAGVISKKYGRKMSLIFSAVLFTISAWGSGLPAYLPQSVSLLVVFRLIGGLGIGIASMNAPMYISELAPVHVRGRLVTLYQLGIVLGFLLVFLVTYFIGEGQSESYNVETGWRMMFWSELVPSILFLLLLFVVPRSPRWLFLQGYEQEARAILVQHQGEEGVEQTISEITTAIKESEGSLSLAEIFKSGVGKIVIIGSVLSIVQQFTGINAVLYYGADIFEKALGFGPDDVLKQQVILASVNVVCTLIAMYLVDKWGRKPLIIVGCIGMIVGFAFLAGTLMTNQVGILSLLGILFFIGSFSLSMGPVVWVLLSEIFPNNARSIGMSIAVSVQWIANYLVSQFFPVVVASEVNSGPMFNGALPYLLFIGFIAFGIYFTLKFIPETKNKSLEEIESIWK